ncbi:GNAT family N-acetyltransferase [Nocardioides sp. GXZ039]|uniref:GNAT family N-acetyltransferase n=1 Tax=Nocardioides sp. GXZ039 TaxID=3136018 RepID=UPI0030F44B97
MELEFYDDAEAFLARAGEHLAADPVLGTVIATVTQRFARGEDHPPEDRPTWWLAVVDDGRVVGAAMRTARFEPRPLFVLPMPDDAAVALALALHQRDEHPGGVNGALPAARIVAEESARLWGGPARVDKHTRLFECREVLGPTSLSGTLRQARSEDADLCLDWFRRFHDDADAQAGRPPTPDGHGEKAFNRTDVDARIAAGVLWLLEDADGDVVHLSGASEPAYGVSRIGPVYTPPEHRGRGHASEVVAELTRRGLAEGTRMCLFTDQANPTSNKIYEAIGYQRVVDMEHIVVG